MAHNECQQPEYIPLLVKTEDGEAYWQQFGLLRPGIPREHDDPLLPFFCRRCENIELMQLSEARMLRLVEVLTQSEESGKPG